MKKLSQYINIRKGKSTIKATKDTIKDIIAEEIAEFGNDADLNHIDVSGVTSLYCAFYDPISSLGSGNKLKNINPDVSKWDTHNVKHMGRCFYCCENFNSDVSMWDTSNVIDMTEMFSMCRRLKDVSFSNWDTRNVERMGSMFFNDPDFEGNGLENWDVRKVESMLNMFGWCVSFNCDLSGWETNHLKYMSGMFNHCKKFNQDLSRWDVSHLDFDSPIAPTFDYFMSITFSECPMPKKFYPKFKK